MVYRAFFRGFRAEMLFPVFMTIDMASLLKLFPDAAAQQWRLSASMFWKWQGEGSFDPIVKYDLTARYTEKRALDKKIFLAVSVLKHHTLSQTNFQQSKNAILNFIYKTCRDFGRYWA